MLDVSTSLKPQDELYRSIGFGPKRDEPGEVRFTIKPIATLKPKLVIAYWKALLANDTLKYRVCNVVDPGLKDVRYMLQQPYIQHYYVLDTDLGYITAEFMLENFTGKAAQGHFSVHPENDTAYSIEVATRCNSDIVNKWKAKDGGPFLKTIFGLTPVGNRVARLFNYKVGFRTVGIIPDAMMDRGKIVDALLVIKTRATAQPSASPKARTV